MSNKSYRIKYDTTSPIDHLKINLNQDFDFLEVLSLKITQEDAYKLYTSNYGVVAGRVLANDGFGIPNAKISIFVKNTTPEEVNDINIKYPYKSTSSKGNDGIRYNTLPHQKVNKCHQNVGSFPSKRQLLDNNINQDVFEAYYEYTTVTNQSGDYMIFGVPIGVQEIHVDIDLSDIGVLSQAPRDMEYKGYNIKQFESPNKFKKGKDLSSLSQIITQNTTVYVYPFWGDETEGEIGISTKIINVDYKFEPTCVFMGSIFTDSENSSINKNCRPYKTSGKMNELISGEGSIEMIRKSVDGSIEKFDIQGTRLIDQNGVWCYQIPMNKEFVITDEYGNIVPTDDPSKGIPTRTDVRFKIYLDGSDDNFKQTKTATYLIPNNPQSQELEDYSFGSDTLDSSFVTLLWNKVYTVKNYIPKVQKNIIFGEKRFSGIKGANKHDNNNPMPYNNIRIDMNLKYTISCMITNFVIDLVGFINRYAMNTINLLSSKKIPYLTLNRSFIENCEIDSKYDGMNYFSPIYRGDLDNFDPLDEVIALTKLHTYNKENNTNYKIGDGQTTRSQTGIFINGVEINENVAFELKLKYNSADRYKYPTLSQDFKDCVEVTLAEENDVINFDFSNDWVNGSLYAPRYKTKVKKSKDGTGKNVIYCGSKDYYGINLNQTCSPIIDWNGNLIDDGGSKCDDTNKCSEQSAKTTIMGGLIQKTINTSNEEFYYYKSNVFPTSENVDIISGTTEIPVTTSDKLVYLQPTEVVLVGSLNDCDLDGIPKLYESLPSTTFKLPPTIADSETKTVGAVIETIYVYTPVYPYYSIEIEPDVFQQITYPSLSALMDADPGISSVTYVVNYYDYVPELVLDEQFYIYNTTNLTYDQIFQTQPEYFTYDVIEQTGYTTQTIVETSGIDWGKTQSNGLFTSINCFDYQTTIKSCLNSGRLCEIGVDLDETYEYMDSDSILKTEDVDGFISFEEINDGDARGMFSTLNINKLATKTIAGKTKYDFTYNYPNGFDGKLKNAGLSTDSKVLDYNKFRFGNTPVEYLQNQFIRTENSFFFYFGVKPGATAIDRFNSLYYVPCQETVLDTSSNLKISLISTTNSSACGSTGSLTIEILNGKSNCNVEIIEYPDKNIYDTSDKIITFSDLPQGSYTIKVTEIAFGYHYQKVINITNDSFSYEYSTTASTTVAGDGSIRIFNLTNYGGSYTRNLYLYTINPTNGLGYYELVSDKTYSETEELLTNLKSGDYRVTILACDGVGLTTDIKVGQSPVIYELTSYDLGQTDINLFYSMVLGTESILEIGVCYSETETTPTTSDDKTIYTGEIKDTLTIEIINLTDNTDYYIRSYITTISGTYYSSTAQLTTLSYTVPNNLELTNWEWVGATNSISTNGIIFDNNKIPITEKGIIYYTTTSPVTREDIITYGTKHILPDTATGNNAYLSSITGLSDLVEYYYLVCYAINAIGTGYSETYYTVLLANQPPVIELISIDRLTDTSVIISGNVINPGSGTITEYGVYYISTKYPHTLNDIITNGGHQVFGYNLTSEINEFTEVINYLTPEPDPGITYKFVIYAKNSSNQVKYSYPNHDLNLIGNTSDDFGFFDLRLDYKSEEPPLSVPPINRYSIYVAGSTYIKPYVIYENMQYKLGFCYADVTSISDVNAQLVIGKPNVWVDIPPNENILTVQWWDPLNGINYTHEDAHGVEQTYNGVFFEVGTHAKFITFSPEFISSHDGYDIYLRPFILNAQTNKVLGYGPTHLRLMLPSSQAPNNLEINSYPNVFYWENIGSSVSIHVQANTTSNTSTATITERGFMYYMNIDHQPTRQEVIDFGSKYVSTLDENTVFSSILTDTTSPNAITLLSAYGIIAYAKNDYGINYSEAIYIETI